MTAAVFRSTPSLIVPPSQNTAPVLEFNCLFTHDLRRKQKRWQDGFLRYHTFNRRVMVYDVPRNFVGDMHWAQGGELQEGDEVTLEKGGVLVQVSEAVGRTETDLSELLHHKKDRSSPAKGANSSSPAAARPTPRTTYSNAPPTHLKHRSLNALLGTPKGALGKAAVPTKSPFDERRKSQENEMWEEARVAKRQKTRDWNITRTTTTPTRNETRAGLAGQRRAKAGAQAAGRTSDQQSLRVKEVIDISSDIDVVDETGALHSNDRISVTPPPARRRLESKVDGSVTDARRGLAERTNVTSHAHAQQGDDNAHTHRPGETFLHPAASEKSRATSATSRLLKNGKPPNRITGHASGPKDERQPVLERAVSPSVSTTSRVRNVAIANVEEKGARDGISPRLADEEMATTKRRVPLKLVSAAPRKMLVCQTQLSRASGSHKAGGPASRAPTAHPEDGNTATLDDEPTAHRQRLQQRMAQIGRKKRDPRSDFLDSTSLHAHNGDLDQETHNLEAPCSGTKQDATTKEVPGTQPTTSTPIGVDTIESSPAFERMKSPPPRPRQNSISEPPGLESQHSSLPNRRRTSPRQSSAEPQLSAGPEDPRQPAIPAPTTDSPHFNATSTNRQPSPPPLPIVRPDTMTMIAEPRTWGAAPPVPQHKTAPPSMITTTITASKRSTPAITAAAKRAPTLDLLSGADPLSSTLLAKPFKPPSKPASASATRAQSTRSAGAAKANDSPATLTTAQEAGEPKTVVALQDVADLGAWSREAFDLLEWRPPWFVGEVDAGAGAGASGKAASLVAGAGAGSGSGLGVRSGFAGFSRPVVGLSGGVDAPSFS